VLGAHRQLRRLGCLRRKTADHVGHALSIEQFLRLAFVQIGIERIGRIANKAMA